MPGSRLIDFRSFRYRGERAPSALSARKPLVSSSAAIAAATSSPGVSAGEGRRTLNPEVAGSIPAGATACRRGVIRRAYGPVTAVIRVRILASASPGGEADRVLVGIHSDGVDAWINHVGIPIEVGSPLVRSAGSFSRCWAQQGLQPT